MGPEIDVDPEITDKSMKENREVVHTSTYCGLKEDENSNQAHTSLKKELNNITREIFGPDISPDDFPDVNLKDMPIYDMYEENDTHAEGGLSSNSEYYEILVMANGLDCEFPTPEVYRN